MESKRLIDKFSYIKKKGLLPLLVRYITVNTVHITLEMLITVYILELFASLTRFFIYDPQNIAQTFIIMLAPLAIALPIAALFSAFFAVYFTRRVYTYRKLYSTMRIKRNPQIENPLMILRKKYRIEIIVAHLAGILFYVLVATAAPLLLSSCDPNLFIDRKKLVLWMSIIGGGLGAIWNITGMFRNQRIIWNKYLDNSGAPKEDMKIAEMNYKCYWWNLFGNACSLVAVFALIATTFFCIHPRVKISSLTTDYWFVVIYLVSLIAVYIRSIVSFLYSEKNKKEALFPSLSTIVSQYLAASYEMEEQKASEKSRWNGNTFHRIKVKRKSGKDIRIAQLSNTSL